VADRVLIVAMAGVDGEQLREAVPDLSRQAADVKIVSPASRLSPAKWLTNEEDDARAEAAAVAERAADAEPSIEAEVGDVDPLQAAEDALRTFDAEELVIVLPPESEASWLERASVEDGFERFGRPVRYVVLQA
jgi:hypothetical protein